MWVKSTVVASEIIHLLRATNHTDFHRLCYLDIPLLHVIYTRWSVTPQIETHCLKLKSVQIHENIYDQEKKICSFPLISHTLVWIHSSQWTNILLFSIQTTQLIHPVTWGMAFSFPCVGCIQWIIFGKCLTKITASHVQLRYMNRQREPVSH